MQRTVDVGVFKFVAQQTGNRINILTIESRSPVLF